MRPFWGVTERRGADNWRCAPLGPDRIRAMTGDFAGKAGWAGQAVADPSPAALLRRHWQSLRGDGGAPPQRERIVPRQLAPMLEHSLLVERAAGGAVLIRHAGLMVCAVHGLDLAGRPLSVLFEAGARLRMLEAVEAVLDGLQTVEMALHSERGMARPPLRARLTLLPLAGRTAADAAAIGCLDLEGPPVLPPRRFRIERVLGEPLAPRGDGRGAGALGAGPVLIWSRP